MPTIQQTFSVSTAVTTVTFSMVLMVMAFGTLLYGNASDRFGRRPVLLTGLALFVGGSVVCAVSESFTMLMVGRVLQALAAGCGVVLARAIARDVYGPDKLAQVIAYLTAAYVLGPTLAPPLGGAISDIFGWNAVFVAAAGFSILIFALAAIVIAETHSGRGLHSSFRSLVSDYGRLLRNAIFLSYAIVPACTSGAFFALAVYGSFLMRDHYEGSAGEYGLYFMLLTLGFMAGNIIAGRLGNRVRSRYMVMFGCVTGVITIALMTAAILLFPDEPLALFAPGALVGVSQGLSLPHAQALAINSEPDLTGTSSGIVMFLHFFAAGFASQMVSQVYDGTFYPMLLVVCCLMIIAMLFALFANSRLRRRESF